MPNVRVGEENGNPVELSYEDHGRGRPVVLVPGWPVGAEAWERQVPALLDEGHRVVTYDRRGFGRSSRPISGYDFDTLAADLDRLITELDLHDAALAGLAMGTGECVRYLSTYGSARVRKAAFLASLPLLTTPELPGRVTPGPLDGITAALARDRHAFASAFLTEVYNLDLLEGERVSDHVVRAGWTVAAGASQHALAACVDAWRTDFRADLPRVSVPSLVLHGDDDRVHPVVSTALPLHQALGASRLVVLEGAPHGLTWTHAAEVNAELVDFLA